MDDSRLPKRTAGGWGEEGRGGRKTDWQACLDGNLTLFGLPTTRDGTPAARNACAWHDMAEAGAETVMTTWRRNRVTVTNIRHARREAKQSTTKRIAEEDKELATTLTSIDEDEDKVVAEVARFKAQLVR